jgi:acetyl esterase/lipase
MKNDIAYANADFIPDAASYPPRWSEDARLFREREASLGRARLNHAYGPGERNRLDLFHPKGQARGVVVFVHGGYWLRFDRSFWSHFAEGLTARDWAVAMPSYTLAPDARIGRIAREIAAATDAAAKLVQGPVRLTGHSAGGHLVARIACADISLSCRDRLQHVVPISPVAELEPLLETSMNADLRIDKDEAATESPTRHPAPGIPVTVWVGAEERPAFLDQARWLAEAWDAPCRIAPGRHHFDVLDDLRTADGPLTQAILS